jgi:1,4-alpha-glucan branching enzyme
VGDFNGWNPEKHPLRAVADSGIWDGFVPGVLRGAVYKYRILSRFQGYTVDKADPYGVRHEVPPRTGSVVWDLDYTWGDGEWMRTRG